MLEYLIKEAIDFYMKENKTSKRQAIYAVNEVIKKLSHEVQEEERTKVYVDTDNQAHKDLINLVNELEIEWEEVVYFITSGLSFMTSTAIKEGDFELFVHLFPITEEFYRFAQEIHENEVKKND